MTDMLISRKELEQAYALQRPFASRIKAGCTGVLIGLAVGAVAGVLITVWKIATAPPELLLP